MKDWGDGCFMQDGLLCRQRVNHNYAERNVIVLTALLNEEIIEAAHGQLLFNHMGISKLK
jgi:hypothetical protein